MPEFLKILVILWGLTKGFLPKEPSKHQVSYLLFMDIKTVYLHLYVTSLGHPSEDSQRFVYAVVLISAPKHGRNTCLYNATRELVCNR